MLFPGNEAVARAACVCDILHFCAALTMLFVCLFLPARAGRRRAAAASFGCESAEALRCSFLRGLRENRGALEGK